MLVAVAFATKLVTHWFFGILSAGPPSKISIHVIGIRKYLFFRGLSLNFTFQLSISIFSISLFLFKFKKIAPFSSINALKMPRIAIIFLLFFSFVLFYEAASPTKIHDTGSYHLATMNWIEQYPTVPGLGNLYGRLALNSSMFSVSTLFILGGISQTNIRC